MCVKHPSKYRCEAHHPFCFKTTHPAFVPHPTITQAIKNLAPVIWVIGPFLKKNTKNPYRNSLKRNRILFAGCSCVLCCESGSMWVNQLGEPCPPVFMELSFDPEGGRMLEGQEETGFAWCQRVPIFYESGAPNWPKWKVRESWVPTFRKEEGSNYPAREREWRVVIYLLDVYPACLSCSLEAALSFSLNSHWDVIFLHLRDCFNPWQEHSISFLNSPPHPAGM